MKNKIYELHNTLFRASAFAFWAKPKKEDLNIPRTKYLGNDDEVIWQIKNDGQMHQTILKCQVFMPHLLSVTEMTAMVGCV